MKWRLLGWQSSAKFLEFAKNQSADSKHRKVHFLVGGIRVTGLLVKESLNDFGEKKEKPLKLGEGRVRSLPEGS